MSTTTPQAGSDLDAEIDRLVDQMLADLPPITDEQRRQAVALLTLPPSRKAPAA